MSRDLSAVPSIKGFWIFPGSTMPALQELATKVMVQARVWHSPPESNFSDFGYIVGEKQIYRMDFSTQRKLVYLYCNLRLLD